MVFKKLIVLLTKVASALEGLNLQNSQAFLGATGIKGLRINHTLHASWALLSSLHSVMTVLPPVAELWLYLWCLNLFSSA